jgi:hypothetical protein
MNIKQKKINSLLALLLLPFTLFGVEVPLTQVLNVDISFGKFNVLELPFKIKSIDKASFIPNKLLVTTNDSGQTTDLTSGGESIADISANAIVVKRGANTLTLFPKKYGRLRMVVWGFKFPVMLEVKVVQGKYPKYYKFTDYTVSKKSAVNFESTSHEKVITKLMKYLFNRKTPKGFENVSKDLMYESNGLKLLYARALVGSRYVGDEWIIQNLTNNTISLYEEMFYKDGVYAISLENDYLKPGEKCRMFVVKKLQEER